MSPAFEMKGRRFGRLKVLRRDENVTVSGHAAWWCRCDCGNEISVLGYQLRRPTGRGVVSCGCLKRERAARLGRARKGKEGKHIELTGQRFGFLTVVKRAAGSGHSHGVLWLCRCDCGNDVEVRSESLRNGDTRSCGCATYARNEAGEPHYIHGGTIEHRREYNSWVELNKRCYNPKVDRYRRYGGRGIRVCDRWRVGEPGKHPFVCFLEDMGPRPKGYSVHRIDNDGDYEPLNCKWATASEQAATRRKYS